MYQTHQAGVNAQIIEYFSRYLVANPGALGIHTLPQKETFDERFQKHLPELIKHISRFINQEEVCTVGFPYISENDVEIREDPSVTLTGLKLVDTSEASWRQVLEFREDEESKRKLRRLRLFFLENYNGKPTSYVVDDLNTRLEDYEAATKKWGMKLVESGLEAVFSANSVVAIAAAGVVSALGGPATITAVLATGAIFEIGNVALKVDKKRRSLLEAFKDKCSLLYHRGFTSRSGAKMHGLSPLSVIGKAGQAADYQNRRVIASNFRPLLIVPLVATVEHRNGKGGYQEGANKPTDSNGNVTLPFVCPSGFNLIKRGFS